MGNQTIIPDQKGILNDVVPENADEGGAAAAHETVTSTRLDGEAPPPAKRARGPATLTTQSKLKKDKSRRDATPVLNVPGNWFLSLVLYFCHSLNYCLITCDVVV